MDGTYTAGVTVEVLVERMYWLQNGEATGREFRKALKQLSPLQLSSVVLAGAVLVLVLGLVVVELLLVTLGLVVLVLVLVLVAEVLVVLVLVLLVVLVVLLVVSVLVVLVALVVLVVLVVPVVLVVITATGAHVVCALTLLLTRATLPANAKRPPSITTESPTVIES